MSIQALAYDIGAHCAVQDAATAEEINPSDISNIQEAVLNDSVAAIGLIGLIAKKLIREEGGFFDHEERLSDLYIEAGTSSEIFKEHHIQALRTAIKSGYFDLARALLRIGTAPNLLEKESDIVQLVLSVEQIHVPWAGAVTRHATDVEVETIELLILHGAPINVLDKDGNSPLYYCCRHKKPTLFKRGSFKSGSFKCLVAAGADISTLHHSIGEHPETENGQKVNLLQIVLDSDLLYGGNEGYHYLCSTTWPFSRDWKLMTSVLIEAGLSFDTNHPVIAQHAQTASYLGNIDLLKRLLGPDVEERARGNRSFLTDFILPSVLCSAVHGRQNGVVSWLLQIGADAHVKYPATTIPNFTKLFGNSHPQSVLSRALAGLAASTELFEMLVDVGSDVEDCEKLLEQCVRGGHFDTMKRLVERGIRLVDVPFTRNIEAIQLLLEHGSKIKSKEFQLYAMGEKDVQLMKYLVGKDGLLLAGRELMRSITRVLDQPQMVQYLITELRVDINLIYNDYDRAPPKNLLSYAIMDARSPTTVQTLIQLGADPELPGLSFTGVEAAFMTVRSRVVRMGPFSDVFLPMLQKLTSCNDPLSFLRMTISDRKWAEFLGLPSDFHPPLSAPSHSEGSKLKVNVKAETHNKHTEGLSNNIEFQGAEIETPIDSIPIGTQQVLVNDRGNPYGYNPLPFPDSIRLLELESSNEVQDPICCRILSSRLAHGPRYEILSGYWGEGLKMMPILLFGQTHHVTAELESALRRVRLKTESRILWIQPICVNVNSVSERSDQISMLRDIYQTSHQLLIWLGYDEDDSHLIFRYLVEHEQEFNLPLDELERRNEFERRIIRRGSPIPDWKTPQRPVAHKRAYFDDRLRLSFQKLCRRPWFYRIWSVPELSLCGDMTIFCGEESIGSKGTDPINVIQKIKMPYSHPGARSDFPWKSNDILGTDYVSWLGDMSKSCSSRTPTSLVWASGSIPLSQVFRMHDIRDLVYCLTAVTKHKIITVDYSVDLAEIFCEMTRIAIKHDRSLAILNACGMRKNIPNLPSWVPDYMYMDTTTPLGSKNISGYDRFEEVPGPKFNGNELAVSGFYLETIHAIGEEMSDCGSGTLEFGKIMHNWECVATQLPGKRFPQSITDAFMDTVVAGRDRATVSDNCSDFKLWYAEYGTNILREHDGKYFEETDIMEEWIGPFHQDPLTHEGRRERYDSKMREICLGRMFFTTVQGSMGLAPRETKIGDFIVCLPWGEFPFPFVLRDLGHGSFGLVGCCYLYDFDMRKRYNNGKLEEREFILK